VVLAHLEAFKAKTDADRTVSRFSLISRLYRRGFGRENIVRLYRFLGWIMKLPPDLEYALRDRIEAELEGKTTMPYLSFIEREAMKKGEEKGREEGHEKGREEGLRAGIRIGLKLRFGEAGLGLLADVDRVQGTDRLHSLLDAIEQVAGIEEFRALIAR
jgi:hypothetical protein